jgi:hypothetical protein
MQTERDAMRACQEYHFWACETARLTEEIGKVVCPNEAETELDTHFAGSPSCFHEAARETIWHAPDDPRRRTLREVREMVKDCTECVRLCDLIRDRRHARQRFGVAKRRVRSVGKAPTPTPEEP